MSAFIRRFTSFPNLDQLTDIEAVNIIDLTPPASFVGVGSGTLLQVGEFEDGPFAAGGDAAEYVNPTGINAPILECYSDTDRGRKYGGFGYTYGTQPYQNPSARRHGAQDWNGNGFLALKYLRTQRLLVARVDTNVGTVVFQPLAGVKGTKRDPFQLTVGQTLTATTGAGAGASDPIAAVQAIVTGAVFVASGFVGGEQISVQVDSLAAVVVTFLGTDQTPAQVVSRINLTLGFVCASVSAGAVRFTSVVAGSSGRIVLAEVTVGALAAIGHAVGTTAGTGNVGNVSAVTAVEIATLFNASLGLSGVDVAAAADSGFVTVYSVTTGDTITISVGTLQGILGLGTTAVQAGVHVSGSIPAGTRVTNGVQVWVTMQSLTIAAGTTAAPNLNPHQVKVRPATDDGSATTVAALAVTSVLDQPTFARMAVTNPSALTAAPTEAAIDTAYEAALSRTTSTTQVTRIVNVLKIARRSDRVARAGQDNVTQASAAGCYGRSYILPAPVGYTITQAIADVATYRTDRVWYTWPAVQAYYPEIATLGAAGGVGFTDSGNLTLPADTALGTLTTTLAPEEDPGQQTGLVNQFFAVEAGAEDLTIEDYTALRAAGICAPRIDQFAGTVFQSGVTSSLEAGREDINRRRMADFVEDSIAIIGLPYSKKLATPARKTGFRADVDGFLDGLLSRDNPDLSRIAAFATNETEGNTPDLEARGVFVLLVKVRTYSSLKFIVIPVEIGTTVTITDSAA